MDEIHKRSVAEIALWPVTLAPLALGLTALLAGWANDGPAWLFFVAVVGVLSSIGIGFTRFLTSYEAIVKQQWEKMQAEQDRKKKERFEGLYEKLRGDRDARTTQACVELEEHYDVFTRNMRSGKIPKTTAYLIQGQMDRLFEACIAKLEQTHELQVQVKELTGSAKTKIKEDRETVVDDVQEALAALRSAVDESFDSKANSELSSMARELKTSMDVAKRTETRLSEMGLDREDKI